MRKFRWPQVALSFFVKPNVAKTGTTIIRLRTSGMESADAQEDPQYLGQLSFSAVLNGPPITSSFHNPEMKHRVRNLADHPKHRRTINMIRSGEFLISS